MGNLGTPSAVELAETAAERLAWGEAADVLADAGDSTFVLDKRAFYLSRAKRYDEAAVIFEQLWRREPRESRHPYMVGYQYYIQGQYADALTWFEKSLELNSNRITVLWRKANALHQLGRESEAQLAAGKVLELWHGLGDEEQRTRYGHALARASYLLGRAQMDRDPQGAAALLRQAADHDAGDHDKHYLLSKALRRAGDLDGAAESMRRARRIKPGQAYIEVEFAKQLALGGDKERAITTVHKVEGRLRGWLAVKAAQVARSADANGLALRLLERASRDRDTRGQAEVERLLGEVRPDVAHRDEQAEAPQSVPGSRETCDGTGTVAVVRADRGFGFLVDDADGGRRHFRLKKGMVFHEGDRVVFTRVDAPKGPAARAVRRR